MSFDTAKIVPADYGVRMEITKFMLVVEDLAVNGGAISLNEALIELGEYIEGMDSTHPDYDKNVVLLMRIAASIWAQLRTGIVP
nr:hypothetical protein [uncultured Albidiferax sp.]